MYVIIAGCGRLGMELARRCSDQGSDTVILDEDSSRFEKMGSGFNGMTVTGIPFDEDVLQEAGIENADTVAAVTEDDNVNVMISEIARRLYHVKCVLTRISDPSKIDTFQKLGFHVICPAAAAADAVFQYLQEEKK